MPVAGALGGVRARRRGHRGTGAAMAMAVSDCLWAAAWAGVASGAPSTLIGIARGDSPLVAVRAAGALAGRESVARGVLVHGALSLGWGAAIAAAVRELLARRPAVLGPCPVMAGLVVGLGCGAAVAALDLEVVGRQVPAIAALTRSAQWLDHLAFGAVAGMASAVRSRPGRDDDGAVGGRRPSGDRRPGRQWARIARPAPAGATGAAAPGRLSASRGTHGDGAGPGA